MAWQDLLDAEIIPGKPPKSSIFFRLRDNLIGAITRAAGGRWVAVPQNVYILSGTGSFAIPPEINSFEVIAQGGGAGVSGGTIVAGGATSFTYNGVTITGGGAPAGGTAGAGGAASGGELNFTGQRGIVVGGGSSWSKGGDAPMGFGFGGFPGRSPGTQFGAGASYQGPDVAGGAGGQSRRRYVVAAGVTTAAYSVGAGGVGTNTANGAPGVIIIRY